jgi:hypothetical protein
MLNFGYHLARTQGDLSRKLYRACASSIVRRPITPRSRVEFDVVSYSSEQAMPEQIVSIRSFLRHVGEPKSFTVVSDGSHSDSSAQLLQQIHPTVRFSYSPDPLSSDLPDGFREYLETHPTGKQLAVIMSLPANGPVLYIDSDVLFFQGASDLITRAADTSAPAFYLADCQFSGDRRLLEDPREQHHPVNTGVLLIFQKLDWSEAIARFQKLDGPPNFFTNQTLAHLVLHAVGARPFDPAKYVLRLDDQFIYSDRYAGPSLALRHYVNPVRHKFWTTLIH